ncbi:MAG TPA: dienelactone hydrolase family protein, partial [Candidatus Eisenbacteria bacterium]|nr:dienelactone hydrolase family protein [Candidatus Eisenbacteria bacterium]
MKALLATIGLVVLIASAVATPAEAAGRISFTQGSTKVDGYLALPNGEGTHPAVIVVQEWWGLNDWVESQTKKLADLGYIALAVDLYKGKTAKDQATAHQLANALDETEAMNMLRSAADFLRGRSDVRANAIGVIGWCMGG